MVWLGAPEKAEYDEHACLYGYFSSNQPVVGDDDDHEVNFDIMTVLQEDNMFLCEYITCS